MQKKGLKYYSLFATMLFVLPVLLQLIELQYGFTRIISLLTYSFVVFSFVLAYLDLKQREVFAKAFNFKNSYRLNIFSYLVAFGFFVEFISNVAILVKSVLSQNSLIIIYFVSACLCALFSLLSSFYFVMVGISYGDSGYDFRSFKLFHVVILLWSITKLLTMFGQTINFEYDINGVLRYLAIMIMSFFFYNFVYEVESEEGTRLYTLLFARMCAYCTGLYSLDRLMLVIAGKVEISSSNTFFAITLAFVCLFTLFFEKSIIHSEIDGE